jgi:asparagine synthase (glutamine-hydrolysing)
LLATADGVIQRQYWDLHFDEDAHWRSIDDAAEALGELLRGTVKDHMISDVPVGFLASGGVDSTALLSYAVEQTDKPIETFTVGFSGAGVVDERPYARLASRRFQTVHREVTVSPGDFRDFLPQYVRHMEEPVCEPPAVALYYVSRLARDHVKVLLSGEGGDEAFGGYPEYRNYTAFERAKTILGPMRGLAGIALGLAGQALYSARLAKYAKLANQTVPDYYYSRVTSPNDYFNRERHSLCTEEFADTWRDVDPTEPTRTLFRRADGRHLLNQMLYVDTKTWLPDDLLLKADKMTMATSLELRVPFLDHKVLEFAAMLPPAFKVRGRETKRVLKRAFQRRVPKEILRRKKAGFPVPYGRWLRGELRGYVADTLLSAEALSRGYFRRSALETILDAGPDNTGYTAELFSLLVLELWHREFACA